MVERIERVDHARGIDYYLEVRLAQARLETWQEEMTLRYHLGEQDSLDIKAGIVTRKDAADGKDHRESEGAINSPSHGAPLRWWGKGDDVPQ